LKISFLFPSQLISIVSAPQGRGEIAPLRICKLAQPETTVSPGIVQNAGGTELRGGFAPPSFGAGIAPNMAPKEGMALLATLSGDFV
jgi:hypothetical protein